MDKLIEKVQESVEALKEGIDEVTEVAAQGKADLTHLLKKMKNMEKEVE